MWRSLHAIVPKHDLAKPLSAIHFKIASLSSQHDQHRLAIRHGQAMPNVWGISGDLALSQAQQRTIYALSTPPGKAGVAVVRVSGADAFEVWKQMVWTPKNKNGKNNVQPEPWKMERCRIVHPESTVILDEGLAVFFKAPKSFTTEDVLELHLHSGRAIISSVLAALSRLPFCRPAEPGEFSRRAFEGGRLDLTQVEGLKDLIDAETEGQRRVALRVAGGATRTRLEVLRSDIIHCLSMIEALIDFGEGEDIEAGVYDQAREKALSLHSTIQRYLSDDRRGEIVRSGIRLAIFGPPNAGKSSLLNFLAQRDAAIVTAVPGTTRDILELSLDMGGIPVIVADTAGIRKTDDLVESIGVERAQFAVQSADVSLCVLSLPEVIIDTPSGPRIQIPPSVQPLLSPSTFFVFNKSDLNSVPDIPVDAHGKAWIASLRTGYGMDDFLTGITNALQERFHLSEDGDSAEAPLITRARHRVHLESALHFLESFLATSIEDVVLGAEELRYAAQAVGKVTGLIDVEDVLDAVFRDFCIGK